ncbi:RNI-like protein [Dioscorea alata]|uniref:RNI-like protein n=1 Tax=Dioscorea alata TaxID=55571 RepID=A0ACB7VNS4_DIOAL|nr:RNI-like protein [Dioscorea alata]
MAAPHGGGEGSGAALCRRWEDLPYDLLVPIFSRIGVEDLIDGVPYVCKGWRDTAKDRACWHSFDFQDWMTISCRLKCRRDPKVDFADLIRFCVSRANQDSIDSIHFPPFAGEEDLLFVAHRCPGLLYFSLESPDLEEDKFCEAISKTERLKGMAVHEDLLTDGVLSHVSRCCSAFSELKIFADDDLKGTTAFRIVEWLPHLRKLEAMDRELVHELFFILLDGLMDLEYLDISGYVLGSYEAIVERRNHICCCHEGVCC